jgi:hypothetical protein
MNLRASPRSSSRTNVERIVGKNRQLKRGGQVLSGAVVERLAPYLIHGIGGRQMLVGQSYPGRELYE